MISPPQMAAEDTNPSTTMLLTAASSHLQPSTVLIKSGQSGSQPVLMSVAAGVVSPPNGEVKPSGTTCFIESSEGIVPVMNQAGETIHLITSRKPQPIVKMETDQYVKPENATILPVVDSTALIPQQQQTVPETPTPQTSNFDVPVVNTESSQLTNISTPHHQLATNTNQMTNLTNAQAQQYAAQVQLQVQKVTQQALAAQIVGQQPIQIASQTPAQQNIEAQNQTQQTQTIQQTIQQTVQSVQQTIPQPQTLMMTLPTDVKSNPPTQFVGAQESLVPVLNQDGKTIHVLTRSQPVIKLENDPLAMLNQPVNFDLLNNLNTNVKPTSSETTGAPQQETDKISAVGFVSGNTFIAAQPQPVVATSSNNNTTLTALLLEKLSKGSNSASSNTESTNAFLQALVNSQTLASEATDSLKQQQPTVVKILPNTTGTEIPTVFTLKNSIVTTPRNTTPLATQAAAIDNTSSTPLEDENSTTSPRNLVRMDIQYSTNVPEAQLTNSNALLAGANSLSDLPNNMLLSAASNSSIKMEQDASWIKTDRTSPPTAVVQPSVFSSATKSTTLSGQVNPEEQSQISQITQSQVNQSQLSRSQINQNQVNQTQINQEQINQEQLTQSQINQGQLGQTQTCSGQAVGGGQNSQPLTHIVQQIQQTALQQSQIQQQAMQQQVIQQQVIQQQNVQQSNVQQQNVQQQNVQQNVQQHSIQQQNIQQQSLQQQQQQQNMQHQQQNVQQQTIQQQALQQTLQQQQILQAIQQQQVLQQQQQQQTIQQPAQQILSQNNSTEPNILLQTSSVPSFPFAPLDNGAINTNNTVNTPINIPVIIIQTSHASNLNSALIANATTTALNTVANSGM